MDAAVAEQATAKETKGAARREAGWRTLLEPKILRRLGVCVVLQFFQQFAGINAIVYFTPHILKSSGTVATLGSSLRLSADSAALLATAVTYFPKIPAMFLTMALMDTWGRAKMLRVFSPAMGLCLAALGLSLGSSSGVAATVALVAIITALTRGMDLLSRLASVSVVLMIMLATVAPQVDTRQTGMEWREQKAHAPLATAAERRLYSFRGLSD